MIATVILAGVADGITVDITPDELKTLEGLMRPSRKQHTKELPTPDGGSVIVAGDMIAAIRKPAATNKAARKR